MADNFDSPGFDYASQQTKIRRKLALANALQQQGLQPLETNRMAGGWAIPISPFEGAAKMLQTYAGGKLTERASEEQKTLATTAQSDYAKALSTALKGSGLGQEQIDSFVAAGSNPMAAQHLPMISQIAMQKRQMEMLPALIAQMRGGQGAPTDQTGQGTVLAPGMAGAPQAPSNMPVGGDMALAGALLGNAGISKLGEMQHADAGTRGGVQYDQSGKAFVVTNNGQVQYLPGITARDKNEMVDTGGAIQPTNPYTGQQGTPIQKNLNPGQQYQIPLDIRANQMAGQRQEFETGIKPPGMPQIGPLPQVERPLPGAVNHMPVPQDAPPNVRAAPMQAIPQAKPILPGNNSPYPQVGMTPKQASELAATRAAAQPKAEFGLQQAQAKAANVIGKIDEAIKQVGYLTAGAGGSVLGVVPGTGAYDLDKTIDTIRANVGFKELADMRAASPMGGALGAVSEKELKYLESAVSALNQGQSPAQLKQRLTEIKTHYQNWLQAVQQSYEAQYGTPNSGMKIKSEDVLSPAEQKELEVLRKRFGK